VRAVDVGVHGGEAVGEGFGDEGLRGEVIALVELMTTNDVEDGRIALQRSGVEDDAV
jgi:hypothetical protein